MTSTRNNNTKSDYCLQQRQFEQNLGYNMYQHSQWGTPNVTAFPAAGSAPPSLMWRTALSNNPIEIENALFGIGSTNLVNPQKPICPELKKLPTINFFERNKVVMPEPFILNQNERPFPTPK
jgi:hypothetical protein